MQGGGGAHCRTPTKRATPAQPTEAAASDGMIARSVPCRSTKSRALPSGVMLLHAMATWKSIDKIKVRAQGLRGRWDNSWLFFGY